MNPSPKTLRILLSAAIGSITLLAIGETANHFGAANAAVSPPKPNATTNIGSVTGNVGCVINGGVVTGRACQTNKYNNSKETVYKSESTYQEYVNSNEGVLIPGNSPLPKNDCDLPGDSISILLGGIIVSSRDSSINVLTVGGRPIIQMEKIANQLFLRTLRIYDDRDNIIARIDEGGFWISPEVRFKRPDKSTLQVFDHLDNEVLWIKFMNPTSI